MNTPPAPVKILLIKMSSMGDIFHSFPAISDLKMHCPAIEIDWLVEDNFAEMVKWHPAVNNVITIQLRQWMKLRNKASWQDFKKWRTTFREKQYDLVIDAQGLLKSALIAKMANTKTIHGFDTHSAREAIARFFYHTTHRISKNQHAVERTRQLFGKVFNYTPAPELQFGLQAHFSAVEKKPRQLIFIIGTSWTTKLWSTAHWQTLTRIALAAHYNVEILWGSPAEEIIAEKIIQACPQATRAQERMSISGIAKKLVACTGVVGLDTGFSHLSGALETPTIALYGATSPSKVGLIGKHTCNVQIEPLLACMSCHKRQCKWLDADSGDTPQCMEGINPEQVWQQLNEKLSKRT
jgi:heptosyltransferase I